METFTCFCELVFLIFCEIYNRSIINACLTSFQSLKRYKSRLREIIKKQIINPGASFPIGKSFMRISKLNITFIAVNAISIYSLFYEK